MAKKIWEFSIHNPLLHLEQHQGIWPVRKVWRRNLQMTDCGWKTPIFSFFAIILGNTTVEESRRNLIRMWQLIHSPIFQLPCEADFGENADFISTDCGRAMWAVRKHSDGFPKLGSRRSPHNSRLQGNCNFGRVDRQPQAKQIQSTVGYRRVFRSRLQIKRYGILSQPIVLYSFCLERSETVTCRWNVPPATKNVALNSVTTVACILVDG